MAALEVSSYDHSQYTIIMLSDVWNAMYYTTSADFKNAENCHGIFRAGKTFLSTKVQDPYLV